MDTQCYIEHSRITGRRSALPDPRVLVEAPRRTFICVQRESQIMARSRELTVDHNDVT